MCSRFTFSALLVSLLGAGCSQPLSDGDLQGALPEQGVGDLIQVSLDVLPPGTYHQHLALADGKNLRYTISIPPNYSPAQPTPLILALHFGTGRRGGPTPRFYGHSMLEVLVKPGLQELNAIMIAPDSIAGRWNNETNEAAALQLMDYVISKYNVDRSKTLVTGFSMGGAGTWYLAGRHQDRFSAAIPIAARPVGEADWKIPLYVIHSRDDGLIPLDLTENHVQKLQSQGVDVQLAVIEGVPHHQTPRFAEPLQAAVPWVRSVWAGERGSGGQRTEGSDQ